MGSAGECNAYEELRRRNVERNEEVLRTLGLIQPRCEEEEGVKSCTSHRRGRVLKKTSIQRRRSARLAVLEQPQMKSAGIGVSDIASIGKVSTSKTLAEKEGVLSSGTDLAVVNDGDKVLSLKKNMEEYNNVADEYSTDASSDSLDELHVDMDVDGMKSSKENVGDTQISADKQGTSVSAVSLDSCMVQAASSFGAQFQELVMRALMQSTTALLGPAAGLVSAVQAGNSGSPLIHTEGGSPASTWTEAAYNKAEAGRKRKPKMMRTSAGEDSDSQEDFVAPENESPQQKSLRTRRLNRFRGRRAKELTDNRKAIKKLPYVLHIDGAGKARGIHKHQWRAAVRGQCSRLDPTMDNINHHAKHVVDSIWHALEKEWEFEGFSHRAREMFEKAATKFMRNRKMQLKYKCKKIVDDKKPHDVNGMHWAKIVDITKKSSWQSTSSSSKQTTGKGKDIIAAEEEEENRSPLQLMESEDNSRKRSMDVPNKSASFLRLEDDVDERIRSLQSELLSLQRSKKDKLGPGPNSVDEKRIVPMSDRASEGMKENVKPLNGNVDDMTKYSPALISKLFEPGSGYQGRRSTVMKETLQEVVENDLVDSMKDDEIDCGDVVRLFAITGGVKKEIAKAIVMGLAGSKYARKIIPKGWRSVKVTAYTCVGAGETCPFPVGWAEQVKQQTIKEANGRSILWPDTHLHSLLHP